MQRNRIFFFAVFMLILTGVGLVCLGQAGVSSAQSPENRASALLEHWLPVAGVPPKQNPSPLNLDQMIGQMLMLGFSGTKPTDQGVIDAQNLLAKGQIGGLILMGANLENKKQVATLLRFLSLRAPVGLPPFLAVDQEGGMVQRLRGEHGFTDVPQAGVIGANHTHQGARKFYDTMAKELADVGFNMNFGPVVDLNLVPSNPIIGMKGRSYGQTSKQVEQFAQSFVLAHRHHNIMTSLKHFPGHGSSWTDSHEQFVDLTKSWQAKELLPYKNLVKRNLVDMVMVGHLYHPQFSDGDQLPASLSRRAIDHLRGDIGFQGLVVTDDLGMGAIKKYFRFEDALIKAVHAGNDILLLVDHKLASPEGIKRIHSIIKQAVRAKKLSVQTLQKASARVMAAKQRLLRAETAAPPQH